MSTNPQPDWRIMSSDLIDLGRDLTKMEDSLRKIQAVGIYGDRSPRNFLWEAKTAARHFVKALETLIYRIDSAE